MKKLDYIDGMKGIGALSVYLCHFVYAFYYAAYSLDAASSHTSANIEAAIGKTPLNLLYSGNSAVCVFLTISGFLLCLNYFRTGDRKRLKSSAAKRYFRLMPMVLIVNVIIFILMSLGLYGNAAAAAITKSEDWFAGFNQFTPDFLKMLFESFVGCFLTGSNDYNGVLWTMPYLFSGALVVYLAAYLVGENRFRYVVYAVMVLVSFKTDVYFSAVFLGFWACDVFCTKERLMEFWRGHKVLPALTFAAGIYFLSYPSIGVDLPGTIYILPAAYTTFWHLGGASFLLIGTLGLPGLQRFFAARPFKKLGEMSYSLYLIHFPVIATFSCAVFMALYGTVGYHAAVLVVFAATTAAVSVLSELCRKYLEPIGGRLIKLPGKRGD